jgi:hypothetical protein
MAKNNKQDLEEKARVDFAQDYMVIADLIMKFKVKYGHDLTMSLLNTLIKERVERKS